MLLYLYMFHLALKSALILQYYFMLLSYRRNSMFWNFILAFRFNSMIFSDPHLYFQSDCLYSGVDLCLLLYTDVNVVPFCCYFWSVLYLVLRYAHYQNVQTYKLSVCSHIDVQLCEHRSTHVSYYVCPKNIYLALVDKQFIVHIVSFCKVQLNIRDY